MIIIGGIPDITILLEKQFAVIFTSFVLIKRTRWKDSRTVTTFTQTNEKDAKGRKEGRKDGREGGRKEDKNKDQKFVKLLAEVLTEITLVLK